MPMSQVRAIIELATQVSYPSQVQLAGWAAYIDAGGSLDEMASAFARNSVFANLYNNGSPVDPNSPISADILAAIVEHSTGVLPSPTQNEQWLGSRSTVLQTLEAFALSDQFGVAAQPDSGHPIPGGYDPFPQFFQIYEVATGNIVTDAQTI